MAGGSQSKVRPDVYINCETSINVVSEVDTHVIVIIGMELDWGAKNKLIEFSMCE